MKFAANLNLKGHQFFFYSPCILDFHVGHVGGKVQNNILSVLLWATANVGEIKYCVACLERLVASQE